MTTTHCQPCECPGQKSSAAIDLRLQVLQFVAQFLQGLSFLAHFLLSAGAVFGTEAQQRLQEQAAAQATPCGAAAPAKPARPELTIT